MRIIDSAPHAAQRITCIRTSNCHRAPTIEIIDLETRGGAVMHYYAPMAARQVRPYRCVPSPAPAQSDSTGADDLLKETKTSTSQIPTGCVTAQSVELAEVNN